MRYKLALFGCVVMLGVTGLGKTFHSLKTYHDQFPHTIIKFATDDLEEDAPDEEDVYPKKAVIHYHLPVDSPLIEEDVVYAVKGSSKKYWDVSVLRKTKDGYVLEHGEEEDEGFLIEDIHAFGFNGYFSPDEPNGEFVLQVKDYDALDDFMDELTDNDPWEDAYLHMAKEKD